MARASDETNTAWADLPVPVDLWRTQFYRTIQNPAAQGRVNITVVNTQEQYRLTDEIAGTHWFVVAWRIEPAAATAKEASTRRAKNRASGAGGAKSWRRAHGGTEGRSEHGCGCRV